MAVLSQSEQDKLQAAIELMTLAQAEELPVDATVSERVAVVAVSSGFVGSTGDYLNAIRDNPVSTLLGFALYLGSQ